MPRRPLLLSLLLTAACSHGGGGPVRQPDGGYALFCKGPLSDCLRHAEHLCKDEGYTVNEARDVRELLGHESGQSQVLIEKSEATIYCGTHAPRAPIRLTRQADPASETVVSATPAAKRAPAPAPAEPARAPVCVPGATQACVGPAGCSGGQTCAIDGTHFEACDCGSK
ncbi:MAG TPA: hypothetical protein VNG33_01120 [Polyangiaceae bacterium]|nr:hypothetical protein [Polyangiaceae bacterium]